MGVWIKYDNSLIFFLLLLFLLHDLHDRKTKMGNIFISIFKSSGDRTETGGDAKRYSAKMFSLGNCSLGYRKDSCEKKKKMGPHGRPTYHHHITKKYLSITHSNQPALFVRVTFRRN